MGFGIAARVAGLAVSTAACVLAWGADHPATPPEPHPAMRIAVAPLGFTAPSAFYLTYRLSSASIGFLDNAHLLFTFRMGGLLRRMPGDQPDDEDQQIRALVLDVNTGQVVKQADWRMHDRSQYLWPLGRGQFLVRVRNTLFLTDSSLELKPYLKVDSMLRSIQVSPDGRWMVIESDAAETKDESPVRSETLGMGKPVKVALVETGSSTATVLSDVHNAVTVPIMGNSVLDALEGKQLSAWVVRAVPLHGEPHTLAEVKSVCQPKLQPVSASVTLVMGCSEGADSRSVVAVSENGEDLWRQTWQNKYVWPWFTSSEDGLRFAYESVEVSRWVSNFDALYPDDVVGQLAGVYDTETGKLVLVRDVSPVLSAGQNVALSPDGRQFAVLRQGAVEIYDLPPVEPKAPDAQKKALARKR